MREIFLSNFILIFSLGSFLLWPHNNPKLHSSISSTYDSVCMVTSDSYKASGVLLKSGYVITAAHAVDCNQNKTIDSEERIVTLTFPESDKYQAEIIAMSSKLDIAILRPFETVNQPGVELITTYDYNMIKIGTPLYIMGMQNGIYPSNITDGRLIDRSGRWHRVSATSYYGNSGGGVFQDDHLVGIAIAVGVDKKVLRVPMIVPDEDGLLGIVGSLGVEYTVTLANCSLYIPVPIIRQFLILNGLEQVLVTNHYNSLYHSWGPVIGFYILLIAFILIILNVKLFCD